jgi:putative tricarboxylic transport membrane protein
MSDPRQRDISGIAGAAVFIVVGILAFWGARDFSPLGAVFPRTIAAAMVLFAVVYIAMALLRPQAAAERQAGSNWRRAALMAVLLAWSFLLDRVGFLATSVPAYAAILIIANYDRWTPRLALAYTAVGAIVASGLYAIFFYLLQVPLPRGLLL